MRDETGSIADNGRTATHFSKGAGSSRWNRLKSAVLEIDRAATFQVARLGQLCPLQALRWMTRLGSPKVFSPAMLSLAVWMAWRGEVRVGIVVAIVALSLLKLMYFPKRFFNRPRPMIGYTQAIEGSSFPSGHAIAGVAAYGVAAMAVARVAPPFCTAVMIASSIVAAVIGLSRVMIGAHWISDVLAGMAAGLVVLALARMAFA